MNQVGCKTRIHDMKDKRGVTMYKLMYRIGNCKGKNIRDSTSGLKYSKLRLRMARLGI